MTVPKLLTGRLRGIRPAPGNVFVVGDKVFQAAKSIGGTCGGCYWETERCADVNLPRCAGPYFSYVFEEVKDEEAVTYALTLNALKGNTANTTTNHQENP